MLFDTHCHLAALIFNEDLDEVISRARSMNVTQILAPGIDIKNSLRSIELAQQYDGVLAAVGVYPKRCENWQTSDIDRLRQAAGQQGVVAIGEIGLDYNWRHKPAKETQIMAFTAQLELAAELNLPIIVHNWQASDDILKLVEKSSLAGREKIGVMHGILADSQFAHRALELGFYLGIGSPITYSNAKKFPALVAKLPLNRILIETDAPNLAPHPHRGTRNEPAYVKYIADCVAAVHGKSLEEIARITTENGNRLFNHQ